ncbi:hypothetical protein FSP39_013308 [Pinctada imbricata]|uniref:C2H2-type domain-containing protein n=1 Tax=Pinctada imbricata TaxID=66713 RepID=A0AA88Y973_PINIB|nr:hypothetical protein FSP39_013308 [Pinctada imbricata]
MATKRKSDDSTASSASKKPAPFWKNGLKTSMEDPELVVYKDDKITVIKDKYPKARNCVYIYIQAKYHFLVMPKENIPNLKSLTGSHIDLLKYMQRKGKEQADSADETLQFRLGYHAVPSMSHLHLHVISQDFDSLSLKTKKHWNSFTTDYFVDSEEIIDQLEEDGKVSLNTATFQELLKKNLKCHVCKKDFSTMPALKTHIKQHNYRRK